MVRKLQLQALKKKGRPKWGAFFLASRCYGAAIVSSTGGPLSARWFAEAVSIAFLKNRVAAPGSTASVPDAILTCEEESFENPVPGSSDHRTFAFCCEEGLEPMVSTHACVALTFSDKPCGEGALLPALTAEMEAAENEATCTLTRGGTVTLTVWVRLLEDPRWASAAREISVLPITIASKERRSLTIYRASSYRHCSAIV